MGSPLQEGRRETGLDPEASDKDEEGFGMQAIQGKAEGNGRVSLGGNI